MKLIITEIKFEYFFKRWGRNNNNFTYIFLSSFFSSSVLSVSSAAGLSFDFSSIFGSGFFSSVLSTASVAAGASAGLAVVPASLASAAFRASILSLNLDFFFGLFSSVLSVPLLSADVVSASGGGHGLPAALASAAFRASILSLNFDFFLGFFSSFFSGSLVSVAGGEAVSPFSFAFSAFLISILSLIFDLFLNFSSSSDENLNIPAPFPSVVLFALKEKVLFVLLFL